MSPREKVVIEVERWQKWVGFAGPIIYGIITAAGAGAFWLFTHGGDAQAAMDRIINIESKAASVQSQVDSLTSGQQTILDRTARMETKQEMMYEWMKATRTHTANP